MSSELIIELSLDSKQFESGISRAQAAAKQFDQNLKASGSQGLPQQKQLELEAQLKTKQEAHIARLSQMETLEKRITEIKRSQEILDKNSGRLTETERETLQEEVAQLNALLLKRAQLLKQHERENQEINKLIDNLHAVNKLTKDIAKTNFGKGLLNSMIGDASAIGGLGDIGALKSKLSKVFKEVVNQSQAVGDKAAESILGIPSKETAQARIASLRHAGSQLSAIKKSLEAEEKAREARDLKRQKERDAQLAAAEAQRIAAVKAHQAAEEAAWKSFIDRKDQQFKNEQRIEAARGRIGAGAAVPQARVLNTANAGSMVAPVLPPGYKASTSMAPPVAPPPPPAAPPGLGGPPRPPGLGGGGGLLGGGLATPPGAMGLMGGGGLLGAGRAGALGGGMATPVGPRANAFGVMLPSGGQKGPPVGSQSAFPAVPANTFEWTADRIRQAQADLEKQYKKAPWLKGIHEKQEAQYGLPVYTAPWSITPRQTMEARERHPELGLNAPAQPIQGPLTPRFEQSKKTPEEIAGHMKWEAQRDVFKAARARQEKEFGLPMYSAPESITPEMLANSKKLQQEQRDFVNAKVALIKRKRAALEAAANAPDVDLNAQTGVADMRALRAHKNNAGGAIGVVQPPKLKDFVDERRAALKAQIVKELDLGKENPRLPKGSPKVLDRDDLKKIDAEIGRRVQAEYDALLKKQEAFGKGMQAKVAASMARKKAQEAAAMEEKEFMGLLPSKARARLPAVPSNILSQSPLLDWKPPVARPVGDMIMRGARPGMEAVYGIRGLGAPLPFAGDPAFVRGGQGVGVSAQLEAQQKRLADAQAKVSDTSKSASQKIDECATSLGRLGGVSSATSNMMSRLKTAGAVSSGNPAIEMMRPGYIPGPNERLHGEFRGLNNAGYAPTGFGGGPPSGPGGGGGGPGGSGRNWRREDIGALSGKMSGIMGQEDSQALLKGVADFNAKYRQLMEERALIQKDLKTRTTKDRSGIDQTTKSNNEAELKAIQDFNARLKALMEEKGKIKEMDRQWRINNAKEFGMSSNAGGLDGHVRDLAAREATRKASPAMGLEGGLDGAGPAAMNAPQRDMMTVAANHTREAIRAMTASFKEGKQVGTSFFDALGAGARKATQLISGTARAAMAVAKAPWQMLGKASEGLNALSFGAWKLTSGLNTLKMAWDGVFQLAKRGEEFERTRYAFETMTAGIGLSMENLRKASGNMIDDKTLMKLSNFGAAAKLDAKTIEMMTSRAQGASLLTGRDTGEVMRRMVQGVAKREKEIMDEITVIMPSMALVNRGKAKQLGKSTTDLTETEKTQAYVEAFEKASRHLEKATQQMPKELTKIQQFQAGITNAIDLFSAKVTKLLVDSGLLDKVGSLIGGALDEIANFTASEGFQTLMAEIGEQAPRILTVLGKALMALSPLLGLIVPILEWLSTVLEGLLPAFEMLAKVVVVVSQIILGVFVVALATVAKVVDTLLGWIPGLGDALGGFSDASGEAAAQLMKVADETKNVTSKAMDLEAQTLKVNDQFKQQITTALDLKSALDGLAASQQEVINKANEIKGPSEKQKAFDALKGGPEALLKAGSLEQVFKGAKESSDEVDERMALLQGSIGKKKMEAFGASNELITQKGSWAEGDKTFLEGAGWMGDLSGNMGDAGTAKVNIETAKGVFQEMTLLEAKKYHDELVEAKKQSVRMLQMGGTDIGKMTKGYQIGELFAADKAARPGQFKDEKSRSAFDTLVEGGMSEIKLTPSAMGDTTQTLDEIIGKRNPFMRDEQIEYARDMSKEKYETFLDAISIDMDAQEGEWKYDDKAVRNNIKAFKLATDVKEDEIYQIQAEIDRITQMSDEQIMAIVGASLTQEQLKAAREGILEGKQVSVNELIAQRDLYSKTAEDLKTRIKPPKGGRGKEPRMILKDIIPMAHGYIGEAMSYKKEGLGGETAIAGMAEDFSARMATDLTQILHENIKEDIKKHEHEIKQVADEALLASNQLLADAAAATTPEDFKRLMEASQAFDQALGESGFLEMADDKGNIRQQMEAKNKNLEVWAKQWEATERTLEMAKQHADNASNMAFELQQKRLGIESAMIGHEQATEIVPGGGSKFGWGGGETIKFDKSDLPDWRAQEMQQRDPAMEAFDAETDRKIEKIRERVEKEKAEYTKQWAQGRKGFTELGGLASIEQSGASEIEGLNMERNFKNEEKIRQQIEAHAAVYRELYTNIGNESADMIGHAMTYPMVDAFSVWQNATLDMTEDWGDNMLKYIEGITGQIGGLATQAAETMIGEATGNQMLGKLGGGVVRGIFDGLKSLFIKKDKRDDDKERRQERELRRKETKKADTFSVTFINQSLPVSAFTQNQIVKNIEGALQSGTKIKGMTGR